VRGGHRAGAARCVRARRCAGELRRETVRAARKTRAEAAGRAWSHARQVKIKLFCADRRQSGAGQQRGYARMGAGERHQRSGLPSATGYCRRVAVQYLPVIKLPMCECVQCYTSLTDTDTRHRAARTLSAFALLYTAHLGICDWPVMQQAMTLPA
jgi:hypothetical protein